MCIGRDGRLLPGYPPGRIDAGRGCRVVGLKFPDFPCPKMTIFTARRDIRWALFNLTELYPMLLVFFFVFFLCFFHFPRLAAKFHKILWLSLTTFFSMTFPDPWEPWLTGNWDLWENCQNNFQLGENISPLGRFLYRSHITMQNRLCLFLLLQEINKGVSPSH